MTDLTPYNTLHVSASCVDLKLLKSLRELKSLKLTDPHLLLGQGANILFTKDYPGTVVKVELLDRTVVSETDFDILVEVAAGEDWHSLVMWVSGNNWSGMENMAFIPGTAGAAVVGNIAAYGQNQGDLVDRVEAVDLSTGETHQFTHTECGFRYRNSHFKDKYKNMLVTKIWYRLSKTPIYDTAYHSRFESLAGELQSLGKTSPYSSLDIAEAVTSLRQRKQPDWTRVGTAGSFFKNPFVTHTKLLELQAIVPELQAYPVDKMLYPSDNDPSLQADLVKIPAGRLLDFLGWKGKTIGRVSTHPTHALSVINLGGATGAEIYEYSETMRADIKKNFNLRLEYEIVII